MRVPDEWLHAVCFLAIDRRDESGTVRPEYIGTAFYMRVPNEWNPDLARLYFVTARHVIAESRKEPGTLYIRVNTEEGGSETVTTSKFEWTFHKDPEVDVAVLGPRFGDKGPGLLHAYIETDQCATPEVIAKEKLGIGSDLTAVGLYNRAWGDTGNAPVIRAGIIAAMPGEPLTDLYLIEMLSMGGLSGSPVFVHPVAGPQHIHDLKRLPDGRVGSTTKWNQRSYLLGLIYGHWDERPAEPFRNLPQRDWINQGIAIVTPVERVLEVLHHRKFREQRRRDAERWTRNNRPTLD